MWLSLIFSKYHNLKTILHCILIHTNYAKLMPPATCVLPIRHPCNNYSSRFINYGMTWHKPPKRHKKKTFVYNSIILIISTNIVCTTACTQLRSMHQTLTNIFHQYKRTQTTTTTTNYKKTLQNQHPTRPSHTGTSFSTASNRVYTLSYVMSSGLSSMPSAHPSKAPIILTSYATPNHTTGTSYTTFFLNST